MKAVWNRKSVAFCLVVISRLTAAVMQAGDQPQWGQAWSRNQVSAETGLPDKFDPATGQNIKWVVPLGTESYSTPVIAKGMVLVGTNNERPRDPRHHGDRGVLLCLNEKDGTLRWQLTTPKYSTDMYQDWPKSGICSEATVDGDRIYVMDNRRSVLCLDPQGMANGNDGPYLDEGKYLTTLEGPPTSPGPLDADIIWRFDLPEQAGIWPHDGAHSSILVHGDFLHLNSCNGVDNTHRKIRKPDAPSLVVLDKKTGQMVARDGERIGPRIFHCTWSSPALARINGVDQIIFCGGDGVVYAFEPLKEAPPPGEVATLKKLWQFDCDPEAPKEEVHKYITNRKVSPSNIKGMPVFLDNSVFVAVGGDIWWGKEEAWLKRIDATRTGDISRTGEQWSVPLKRHSCTTPAIFNGLVIAADCAGQVLCLEAASGRVVWTLQMQGDIWSSPLVADGKIFIGTRRGDFCVLEAGKELKVLHRIMLDSGIVAAPVAANKTLYLATLRKLYAIGK